jgi:hypothetical protein
MLRVHLGHCLAVKFSMTRIFYIYMLTIIF